MIKLIRVDKYLLDMRELVKRDLPANVGGHRDLTPSQKREVVVRQGILNGGFRRRLSRRRLSHKDHADRIMLSQLLTKTGFCLAPHEGIGHLQ